MGKTPLRALPTERKMRSPPTHHHPGLSSFLEFTSRTGSEWIPFPASAAGILSVGMNERFKDTWVDVIFDRSWGKISFIYP